MAKVILHSDCNNFYASVESVYDESLKNIPFAVGGSKENRHGIVLSKNDLAKKMGVLTAEPYWQAKKKCPDLKIVPPNFDRYIKFSTAVKKIYSDYTDLIESFGLDECFLDVTGSKRLFGTGQEIANKIRERIRSELGITVSVGVSYNKIFAKLGSDMKKPDATTAITKENFKEKVWPLSARSLLFVGRKSESVLLKKGVNTIGDIAKTDVKILEQWFGKSGKSMWQSANGIGSDKVAHMNSHTPVKSIGNGTTVRKDLQSFEEAKSVLYMLCESVAARLRAEICHAYTVGLAVKYSDFETIVRQETTEFPTCTADTLYSISSGLFLAHVDSKRAVRSITVRCTNLERQGHTQTSFLPEVKRELKQESLEKSVDCVREKFGWQSVKRAVLMDENKDVLDPNIKGTLAGVAFDK